MRWRPRSPLHLADNRPCPRCPETRVIPLRSVLRTEFRRLVHDENAAVRAPSLKHSWLLDGAEKAAASKYGGLIKVSGLVRSIRKQKRIAFAHINDGTTLVNLQAVFSDPALAKDVDNGAYVVLEGKWVPSQGGGQNHELLVEKVNHIGTGNAADAPLQKKTMSTDFLRTVPHLRMRTGYHALVNRTRSFLISAITEHFARGSRPAYQVLPPLITSSDCEGAGEAFTISPQTRGQTPLSVSKPSNEPQKLYFKEPKYLTVSSQLHLEAHSAEMGDVFAFSPTFRAEESDTPRHLSEFYMLEAEFRDIELRELMSRVQTLLRGLVARLRDHRVGKELLQFSLEHKQGSIDAETIDLEARWKSLSTNFAIIDYTTVMEELARANESSGGQLFVHSPAWGLGLQLEHERWVVENLGKGSPVFVTHYPKTVKPFYMLYSSQAGESGVEPGRETVACFDLLLPFGYCEVVGGSLRQHRLEHLIVAMREKGLLKHNSQQTDASEHDERYPHLEPGESLGNLKWYADLRRYGSSPHGGYGLGFDRLVAYLVGASSLRDVVPFPRSWGRADC